MHHKLCNLPFCGQHLIGRLVKFSVNMPHGKSVIAGTVKIRLPDGSYEVKSQQGGYYKLAISEIIL